MTKRSVGEPIRVVPDTAVRAMCAECSREVAGTVGLRMVIAGRTIGVEVYVCEPEEMHLLVRVPLEVLPFVEWDYGNSCPTAPK